MKYLKISLFLISLLLALPCYSDFVYPFTFDCYRNGAEDYEPTIWYPEISVLSDSVLSFEVISSCYLDINDSISHSIAGPNTYHDAKVFVGCGLFGLIIVDVSEPHFPYELGRTDGTGSDPLLANGVGWPFVREDSLVIGLRSEWVLTVNCSDPTDPYLSDTTYFRANPHGRYIRNDTLFVVSDEHFVIDSALNGFAMFDISNPRDIIFLDSVRVPDDEATAITANEDYIFTGDFNGGIYILEEIGGFFDIVGEIPFFGGEGVNTLNTKDDYLFCNTNLNFRVYDISIPLLPDLVFIIPTGSFRQTEIVSNKLIFTTGLGIGSMDISRPDSCYFESFLPIPIGFFCFGDSNMVYANGWDSLFVLRTIYTEIDEEPAKPEEYEIKVYPNPFNSSCKISGFNGLVSIYNINGDRISKLETPGIWKPSDNSISSGIYFLRGKGVDGKHFIGKTVYIQ